LDLLEAQRNIPTTPKSMTALFNDGLDAFWRELKHDPQGLFATVDFAQLKQESARLFHASHIQGNSLFAPEALQDTRRGLLRDPGLGTIGSGNHFAKYSRSRRCLTGTAHTILEYAPIKWQLWCTLDQGM